MVNLASPCLSWVCRSQIVSGSRDKTIKLWNTLGECKYTIGEPDGHTEWVSCVRFSPVTTNPIIVSAGWDKLVKVNTRTKHKGRTAGRSSRYRVLSEQAAVPWALTCLFRLCTSCHIVIGLVSHGSQQQHQHIRAWQANTEQSVISHRLHVFNLAPAPLAYHQSTCSADMDSPAGSVFQHIVWHVMVSTDACQAWPCCQHLGNALSPILQAQPHSLPATVFKSCLTFQSYCQSFIACFDAAMHVVQVWNLTNCKLRSNLVGHTGYINTVTVSPDGSLCASGGKVGSSIPLLQPIPLNPTCPAASIVCTIGLSAWNCLQQHMCTSKRLHTHWLDALAAAQLNMC